MNLKNNLYIIKILNFLALALGADNAIHILTDNN
jgi:hypothetical protein